MTKTTESQDTNEQNDAEQRLTDAELSSMVGGVRMQASRATTGAPVGKWDTSSVTDMRVGSPTDLNVWYTNM